MFKALALLLLLCVGGVAQVAPTPPSPVQAWVNTQWPVRKGPRILVEDTGDAFLNGQALQEAIDLAPAKSTILLPEGVEYKTPTPIRVEGKLDLTIMTDSDHALRFGVRTTGQEPFARILTSNNQPAIDLPGSETPSRGIRLQGLYIGATPNVQDNNTLIKIGGGAEEQTSLLHQPHNIVMGRVVVKGNPTAGHTRGITLNGSSLALVDSRVEEIHRIGFDTQAVCGWNGSGPFLLCNNFLEGAGENVIFGGADASIPGLVPSDGTICHNHFFKPFTWMEGHPTYQGIHWGIKNLFELKNAQRFEVSHNLFENSWLDAQIGHGIVFTPRNQDGSNPWARVQDVDFHHNIVRRVGNGFNLTGEDARPGHPSERCARIRIAHNSLEEIRSDLYGGFGTGFLLASGVDDLLVEGNSLRGQNGSVAIIDGPPSHRVAWLNNDFDHGEYGFKGGDRVEGNDTFSTYFTDLRIEGNILRGFPIQFYTNYPSNTFL